MAPVMKHFMKSLLKIVLGEYLVYFIVKIRINFLHKKGHLSYSQEAKYRLLL